MPLLQHLCQRRPPSLAISRFKMTFDFFCTFLELHFSICLVCPVEATTVDAPYTEEDEEDPPAVCYLVDCGYFLGDSDDDERCDCVGDW